jgi:hypothetical protein
VNEEVLAHWGLLRVHPQEIILEAVVVVTVIVVVAVVVRH